MAVELWTPGQKEEALSWLKENCKEYYDFLEMSKGRLSDTAVEVFENMTIDMYFKLKQFTFALKPEEFIIGIEYKDKDKVIAGEEKINIRFHNPHSKETEDSFAYQIVLELLNRLK